MGRFSENMPILDSKLQTYGCICHSTRDSLTIPSRNEDHGDGGLEDYRFFGENSDRHDDEDHMEILEDDGDPG